VSSAAPPPPARPAPARPRVVLADDAVLLRAGLERLLVDAGWDVVAAVGDGDALVAAVAEHRPDAVVADVRMPPTHTDEGLRAVAELRRIDPQLPVLVLSQVVEASYAADLLARDPRGLGYLLKDRVADVADFLAALERVRCGGTALDPEVVAQLLSRRAGSPLATLTPREREVLGLLAEGLSNRAVAERMVVSAGAVEKHVASVFGKLGLHAGEDSNRRVLAVLAHLGVR